ncbi:MAG: ECF transporter S component [Lagierella massiliensis]|nr:ECF transporter S component [Lagierella massiliensis]
MKNTKNLVYAALMTALVTIGTMFITVPSPRSGGYLNLGDAFIHLSSFLFGPYIGLMAGGIGSALADIFGGYAHYAIPTLIIKGSMGLCVGLAQRKAKGLRFNTILALVVAELIMVFGYYITNMFFAGTIYVGIASIPSDMVQGGFGILLFLIMAKSLSYTPIQEKLGKISYES